MINRTINYKWDDDFVSRRTAKCSWNIRAEIEQAIENIQANPDWLYFFLSGIMEFLLRNSCQKQDIHDDWKQNSKFHFSEIIISATLYTERCNHSLDSLNSEARITWVYGENMKELSTCKVLVENYFCANLFLSFFFEANWSSDVSHFQPEHCTCIFSSRKMQLYVNNYWKVFIRNFLTYLV